jgi:hypothetical protein
MTLSRSFPAKRSKTMGQKVEEKLGQEVIL